MARAVNANPAPKKAKTSASKQSINADDYNSILEYLRQQNRPYSLNDIVLNLHGTIGKTSAQRCIDKLIADGEILEKVYGKQSVYVIQQNNLEVPSVKDLDEMDNKINELKSHLSERKESLKKVMTVMGELESKMTLDQLKSHIVEIKSSNEKMLDKIRDLQSGTRKVDPVEKARVDKDLLTNTKLFKSRKMLCLDAVNMICEGISSKPKDFMNEIGLELDS